jgi:dipeptidyl aminopeptidase/acylaminoacyl peptidase
MLPGSFGRKELKMKKTLTADSFTLIKNLTNLSVSPSRESAAFVLTDASLKKDRGVSVLYGSDGFSVWRISPLNASGIYCFEDDEHLLFSHAASASERKQAKEQKTFMYRIGLREKHAHLAFVLPVNITKIERIENGRYLLCAPLNDALRELLHASDRKQCLKADKSGDYEEFDELPFYGDGKGWLNGKKDSLILYDENSKTLTEINRPNFAVNAHKLSRDHRIVYYSGQDFSHGIKRKNDTLIGYDLQEGKEILHLRDPELTISAIETSSDKLYVLASDEKTWGYGELPYLFEVDADGLKQLAKISFDPVRMGNIDFDNQPDLTILGAFGISSHLYRYKNGILEEFYQFGGDISEIATMKDCFLWIGARENELAELHVLKNSRKGLRKISRFNRTLNHMFHVSDANHFSYAHDSLIFDGWVMKPVNYQPDKKYPGILQIHGGPRGAYSGVYRYDAQLLANQGYFVFFTNPRGSSRRGNEFADVRHQMGYIDYQDLMHFTDEVLKRYPALDSERLGVTGISYGGYMTNWIISHTERFAAAISENGVSNWISQGSLSDISYDYVEFLAGDPIKETRTVWNQSPLKFAEFVKTPTLFIHSDNDFRCPLAEGLQFFTRLKVLGVDVKFLLFKGDSHGVSRLAKPTKRYHRFSRILAYFDEYLKPKE